MGVEKKQPMTTAEFFEKICEMLKANNQFPSEILDYSLATRKKVKMETYEFSIHNNLDYGGSEGIYLDVWIECFEDNDKRFYELGTFKTLQDTPEAMRIMAQLLADFIVAETKYVNDNIDDFTWQGADVRPLSDNGECLNWGYSCKSMDSAMKKKDELLKNYHKVVVRDNATRKEIIYEKEGMSND